MFTSVRKLFGDKFAGAGEGQRLDAPPAASSAQASAQKPPLVAAAGQAKPQTEGASRAGQAALERLEKKQAPKQRTPSTGPVANATRTASIGSAETVETLKPSNQPTEQAVKLARVVSIPSDPLTAAVDEIRFPPADVDDSKIEACISIVLKYIDNILSHPDEEKYRRIRLTNAIYLESVAPVPGARVLLATIGFQEVTETVHAEGNDTPITTVASLVLPPGSDVALLQRAKALLTREPEFNRDTRVYRPSALAVTSFPDLPEDFYVLSKEEARFDLQNRRARADQEATLRTREMRERDAQKTTTPPSPVTCIRVRFVDGYTLQGRFASRETVQDIYAYVRQCISTEHSNSDFVLTAPQGVKLDPSSNQSLQAAQLSPAVLLHVTSITGGPQTSPKLMDALHAIAE